MYKMLPTPSSKDEMYIMFYTSLLETFDQRDGQGFTPKLADVIFKNNDFFFNRLCNYISPPFCACKIAFRGKDGFETYGFFGRELKFSVEIKDFLDKSGFCFLKLNLTWYQMNIVRDILKKLLDLKDSIYLSYYKSSLIGGKTRYWCCMGPNEYPQITQKAWTCSELVTWVLQQAGVIDEGALHPTYTSPTNLFLELLGSKYVDISRSFNIFCNNDHPNPNVTQDNTNAYYLYCKIMGITDAENIERIKEEFMSSSLCRKFKVKTSTVNIYTMSRIINEKDFNLYAHLEGEREDIIRSLPIAPTTTPKIPVQRKPIQVTPTQHASKKSYKVVSHDTPLYA